MSHVYVLNLIDESDVLTRVQIGCMDNDFTFAMLCEAADRGIFHSFIAMPVELAPGDSRGPAEMLRVESFIKSVRERMV